MDWFHNIKKPISGALVVIVALFLMVTIEQAAARFGGFRGGGFGGFHGGGFVDFTAAISEDSAAVILAGGALAMVAFTIAVLMLRLVAGVGAA